MKVIKGFRHIIFFSSAQNVAGRHKIRNFHKHVLQNSCFSCEFTKNTPLSLLRHLSSSTQSGDDGKRAKHKHSDSNVYINVKVMPTSKPKLEQQKTDFSKIYLDNVFITPLRAIRDYFLEKSDLEKLAKFKKRSPYPERDDIFMYLRIDVERCATEKFGSLENLQKEREKRAKRLNSNHSFLSRLKYSMRQYRNTQGEEPTETPYFFHTSEERKPEKIFKTGTGKVVLYAVTINGANCIFKLIAWLYTGSASMFAELVHSIADTGNQLILAYGLHKSLQQPDLDHPYGWTSFRNVASLVSGVAIFCLGAGVSFYHGINVFFHPSPVENLFWAIGMLGGSFLSEGATLLMAFNHMSAEAAKQQMTLSRYVWEGSDPMSNVVLLEDIAAVTGVAAAATCMALSHVYASPVPDAVGSLLVGTLLGGVASFIIYSNTVALVGRSIPEARRRLLMKELENDRMIRSIHDVKATTMGGSEVRFKAEIDFDGREVTRLYLQRNDIESMLKELKAIGESDMAAAELEMFIMKHGESIVDTLGSEVDRIERNLKKKHPEIRHVDLEQL